MNTLHKIYLAEAQELIQYNCPNECSIQWESPANIALVKYWGKYNNQLARNPSVSFTLSRSVSNTKVVYSKSKNNGFSMEFFFENQLNQEFQRRIEKYMKLLFPYMPFLQTLNLKIYSSNTFPHSAGIASSASSISALALCLCSIEQQLFGTLTQEMNFLQKASFLSRLGSGSACRSIYGPVSLWGNVENIKGVSYEAAVPIKHITHPVFKTYHDAILVVNSSAKSISSSSGHNLMNNHDFAEARYLQANKNLRELLAALESGDEDIFTSVVENEALTLHSLLLSSKPGYILLHPNTLQIIHKINDFRKATNISCTYSIDAGPNIHLLYPERNRELIIDFIESELTAFCENGVWIDDMLSDGPVRLKT